MYLHDAMEKVLREHGGAMTIDEIAKAINEQGLYTRKDGEPLPAYQIDLRLIHYKHMFTKHDGKVHLLPDAVRGIVGKQIKIIEMVDEPRYAGKTGIVDHFDSDGQMHGSWGGLAIQPERDKFEVID